MENTTTLIGKKKYNLHELIKKTFTAGVISFTLFGKYLKNFCYDWSNFILYYILIKYIRLSLKEVASIIFYSPNTSTFKVNKQTVQKSKFDLYNFITA